MKPIAELSLGWRTHLIFPRFDAEVTLCDDHLLVRTPRNPTFWWGNCVLFDHAPQAGDAVRWQAAFDDGIASRQPESRHVAIGVDSEAAFDLPADFAAAGFTLGANTVLTMRPKQLRALPSALPPGCRVAPLTTKAQLTLAVESQVAADQGRCGSAEGYRLFATRQMQRYADMAESGLGQWFGVFVPSAEGERIVADCGLFRDAYGPGALGRFQQVATHPAWRRQGLCRALIHAVCRHGFDVMKLGTLVIVADPDDVAIGLSESLGFERGARTWNLTRWPAPQI